MSTNERKSSEILQRIHDLQDENHKKTIAFNNSDGSSNEFDGSERKSDNPIQNWIVESIMNKPWY